MKKTTLSCRHLCGMALLLAVGSLSAQDYSRAGQGYQVSLTRADRSSQQLSFTLGNYRMGTVELDGQTFTRFTCDSRVTTSRKGYAELPYFHAALQLPVDKKYQAVVENEVHEDIPLNHPMLPSRGVIYRNETPSTIPFVLASEATREGLYPSELVTSSEPFIMRDVKGQNFYFNAVQYDAGSMTLRVTKSLTVRLEEVDDRNEESLALMTRGEVRPVAEMNPVYGSLFMNYAPPQRWQNELKDFGDVLVLTTSAYKDAIKPWVDHKTKAGYKVTVQEITKGSNGNATKEIIKKAYEANKDLLYVQLVGGWSDIQSPLGGGANKPMDPTLGWLGSQGYATVIVGRFSASSAADVTAQVNKAIGYETETDTSWLKNAIGIASPEGAGQGDDGQSDIEHMSAIRDGRLKPNGFTVTDAHGKSASKSSVTGVWGKGASIVNYVGHGSETSFGTTGFNASDARALSNGNKAPIVVSVACLNGSFTSGNCLAEAAVKNAKGGAVVFMGSTINQPWQPPMRGQDYFNDLLIGGHKYPSGKEKGTTTDHGKLTYGSLAANAHTLMYAESGQNPDLQTVQTWTSFGDITLKVRTPKNPNGTGPKK